MLTVETDEKCRYAHLKNVYTVKVSGTEGLLLLKVYYYYIITQSRGLSIERNYYTASLNIRECDIKER